MIDIDRISQRGFQGYHRSGWAHAVAGLRYLTGAAHGRDSGLILDTYLDRTFHWGCRVLEVCGRIPYREPWCGFIHHTFDLTHHPEEVESGNVFELLLGISPSQQFSEEIRIGTHVFKT